MSNGCECGCGGKDEKLEKIREVIAKCNGDKSQLIHVLNEVQELYGYVPTYVQKVISDEMDIPMAEIYGVITFYSRFSLEAKGKYNISVCLGTACYVRGADKILEAFKKTLGIEVGQTTPDGRFSLDALRCVGACGLAPVALIGDKVYGRISSEEEVKKIISEYES